MNFSAAMNIARHGHLVASGAAAVACLLALTAVPSAADSSEGPVPIHVQHNQIVDAANNPIHLVGVNRSGSEYACVQGWGVFDGPSDDASVAAMAAWGMNAVRIGLNEDCWLGINGVPLAYGGEAYRRAIVDYVAALHRHSMYAIVALMWAAPGRNLASWQEAMADADHSAAFWASVAETFSGDLAVLFDLYGEPAWIDWSCWADGCLYRDAYGAWQTAGMRTLLRVVRSAHARNIVMIGGPSYANDLSGWLAYAPQDPAGQLAASFHVYGDNTCHDAGCWDSTVTEVAKRVPVVTGEVGERADGKSCGHAFVESYLDYAHAHGISYLAWAWDAWGVCTTLITDYRGDPTPYGAAYKERLLMRSPWSVLAFATDRPSRPLIELPAIPHRKIAIVFMAGCLVAVLAAMRFLFRRKYALREPR